MASTIKLRRGTASEWTSANPTLSTGEFGYETDTSKLKIGDGSTSWTSLDYFIDPTSTVLLNDITDVNSSAATTGQILVAQSDGTFAFENTQYFDGAYSSLTGAPTNVSSFTNDSGYLTDYTVTESDVTTHQAALSITESQISDLQTYLTSVSESDVTQHQAALSITESQISDLGSYLSTVALNDLTDVAASSATTGHVLTAQSDGTFAFEAGSTVANLNDLTDVNASSATTGQVLTAQSDGSFAFADASGGTVYQNTYIYEASSGQTNFTGADDNGYGLTFTSGQTMVFLNGVLLVETTDYSEDSDLAGITLVESANSGDIILISTWETSDAELLYTFQGSSYGYASGGYEPSPGIYSNIIEKYSFTTDSNATDVGDLTVARNRPAGQTSADYGYTSAGRDGSNPVYNIIDKFPFSTDANATDVGDLAVSTYQAAGQSSENYGYSSGGKIPTSLDNIQKHSFATDGNATDIANLTIASGASSGQSSSEYGYTSGGYSSAKTKVDKFPFATDANATDVGDLTVGRYWVAGQSSEENGYVSGGYVFPNPTNTIDKFPFATDSNATDVGDLTVNRYGMSGSSSTASGYTAGGTSPVPARNVIDKFPFASDANATDVGDLTTSHAHSAGQQY